MSDYDGKWRYLRIEKGRVTTELVLLKGRNGGDDKIKRLLWSAVTAGSVASSSAKDHPEAWNAIRLRSNPDLVITPSDSSFSDHVVIGPDVTAYDDFPRGIE